MAKITAKFNQSMMSLIFRQGMSKMSTVSVPVITVPAKLKQHFRKIDEKEQLKDLENKRLKSMQGDRKVPIISCKHKKFNHYKGQVYDKFQPLPLASKGWHHYKAAGDYFTIHSYGGNPAFTRVFRYDEPTDFSPFDFHENIIEGLTASRIKHPTNVQMLAIPPLLEGRNVLCAAETGTGKTLAYLLPMIELIIRNRSSSSQELLNAPVGLVIVPSRELAEQIGLVAKNLEDYIPFRSKVLVGGTKLEKSAESSQVDVVIATLGTLQRQVDLEMYDLSQVKHLVLDEADTLLDDSFNRSLINFISRFKLSHDPGDSGVQLALFGATMPRDITNIIGDLIPIDSLHKVTTTYLHRLMPHIPQKFMRVRSSEKPEKLLELVKRDFKSERPVMIFSKDARTCDFVSIFLEHNDISNVALHGEISPKQRQGKFNKFQSGDINVISCTDIGSRGLDTLRVHHVINFSFPSFMSDYIHRAGRTGRVGTKVTGHVTSLISKGFEIELVQKIEMAARTLQSLPNVNANITRKLNKKTEEDDYL